MATIDRLHKALGDLGFSGALPDRMFKHLGSLGHTGAMNDRLSKEGGYQTYVSGLVNAPTIAPVITLQPLDVTVDEGVPWSVVSAASGATSSEWFKDAVATGNTTNTIGGTGLVAESGTYFNRYTNAVGDTDTSNSIVTITPATVPRVFIADESAFDGHFTSDTWTPTGDFKIRLKMAKTSAGTSNMWVGAVGDFTIRWLGSGRIGLYHNGAGSSGTFYGSGAVAQTTNLLHDVVIHLTVGSTAVVVEVNGVVQSGGALLGAPAITGRSGNVIFGDNPSLSSSELEGIVADIQLEDVGVPANTYTWAVDLDTGSAEVAQEGGKTLTYVGVDEGLPTRELFTFTGTTWVGNNGTTLTIA